MISIRAAGRLVLTAIVTSAAALGIAAPSFAAPSTGIDPAALKAGSKAKIAYLDSARERIVLPSGRTISTKRFDYTGDLLHVRGGWLLAKGVSTSEGRYAGTTVYFVSSSGRSRVVVRQQRYNVEAVSADGRWYVAQKWRSDGSRPGDESVGTLRAVRISDGRTIDSHIFKKVRDFPVVLSVSSDQAVVRTIVGKTAVTTAWTPGKKTARILDRRRSGPTFGAGSSAAHRYTVPASAKGYGDVVLNSRTHRKVWSVAGESVLSFSPDDKRVITTSGPTEDYSAPWELSRRLRVRNAATGKVLATFTGYLGIGYRTWAPVWESPTTVLLHATGKPKSSPSGDSTYPDQSIVRCSVTTGACARLALTPRTTYLMVRKSN